MWAAPSNLQQLNKDTIEGFLAKPQRASKALVEAYRLSLDAPNHRELAQPPAPPGKKPTKEKAKTTSKEKASKEKKERAPVKEKKEKAPAKEKKEKKEKGDEEKPDKKRKLEGSAAASAAVTPASKKRKTPSKKDKEPPLSREEIVWDIRRVLQNSLCGKQKPVEEKMERASETLGKLEEMKELELSIVRKTKINKVMQCIAQLNEKDIPKESKYHFTQRARKLLERWYIGAGGLTSASTLSATTTGDSDGPDGQAVKDESVSNNIDSAVKGDDAAADSKASETTAAEDSFSVDVKPESVLASNGSVSESK